MMRTSAAALMLSTALMTGTALAQTSSGSASTAGTNATTQFLTEQDRSQYRASKFIGLPIYGQDDQRIGDVNEILVDGTGTAKAIVVGVGGFLGIGEKNVALPFSAVEWVNDRPASSAASSGTGSSSQTTMNSAPMNAPANSSGAGGGSMGTAATGGSTMAGSMTGGGSVSSGTAGGMGASNMGTGAGMPAGRDTAATGSTSTAPARSPAETAATNGYPDHGKVRLSKADLQNAPTFNYYGDARSNSGSGTTGAAPRQ